MKDWVPLLTLTIAVVALTVAVWACNSSLCGSKGGHLSISLLDKAGYACVDARGRQITIP